MALVFQGKQVPAQQEAIDRDQNTFLSLKLDFSKAHLKLAGQHRENSKNQEIALH